MDPLLVELEQLYAGLSSSPSPGGGNACGNCRLCCTAQGLSQQRVTALELALLEHHYGPQEDFSTYVQRTDPERFPRCPHLGPQGCQVYAHRPFSCRVFGHYRAEGTRLPVDCVYEGHDQTFPAARYYEVVPGAVGLREISRDFQLRQIPKVSEGGSTPSNTPIGLNLQDPWDQALEEVGAGRIPQLPPEQEGERLFASYVRALVAGEQQDHETALRHYLRVLRQAPLRADLMTFAGLHAFQQGRMELAGQLWTRSLELEPANPLALSFLGYLFQHLGQWEQAARCFGEAARLQPDQPLHQQRRDQALARWGEVSEGGAPL